MPNGTSGRAERVAARMPMNAQQHEIEEDAHEQDRAPARRDQPVRDGRETVAVVAHCDHDCG
jgi:hypothetical protein